MATAASPTTSYTTTFELAPTESFQWGYNCLMTCQVANLWAYALPSNCTLQEETEDPFPAEGSDCLSFGVGAVAWDSNLKTADNAGWLMYCNPEGKWTVPTISNGGPLKTRNTFISEGKPWVRINVDPAQGEDNTVEVMDENPAWTMGTVNGLAKLSFKSADPTSFWNQGGSLYICHSALATTGLNVARISNKGQPGDTPSCADTNIDLNGAIIGTPECPVTEFVPKPVWALSLPSSCEFEEIETPFPEEGSDCQTTYETGAVAWSKDLYNEDSDTWLMYCAASSGLWMVPSNLQTKFDYENDGSSWVRLDVDQRRMTHWWWKGAEDRRGRKGSSGKDSASDEDSNSKSDEKSKSNSKSNSSEGSNSDEDNDYLGPNTAWTAGRVTSTDSLDRRSGRKAPSGWKHGGSLNICLDALVTNTNVARISSLGWKKGGVPACATASVDLNGESIGTDICPVSRPRRW